MNSDRPNRPNLHLDLMLESAELSLEAIQAARTALGATALEAAHEIPRARIRDAARALGRAAAQLENLASPPEPLPEPYDEEVMFRKIVPPQIKRPNGNIRALDLIEITIEDDTTVVVHGRRIPLARRKLFIFNRLVTSHKILTREFFGKLFDRSQCKSTSSERRAIYKEINELRVLLGLDLIQSITIGKPGQGYALSQAVYFTDIREPRTVIPAVPPLVPEEVPIFDPLPPQVHMHITEPAQLIEQRIKPAVGPFPEEKPTSFMYREDIVVVKNVQRTERPVDRRPWRPVEQIAGRIGLPIDVVGKFIDRNRFRFGAEFLAPKRKAVGGGRQIEVFSPQFVEWAVASLERAKANAAKKAQSASENGQ